MKKADQKAEESENKKVYILNTSNKKTITERKSMKRNKKQINTN